MTSDGETCCKDFATILITPVATAHASCSCTVTRVAGSQPAVGHTNHIQTMHRIVCMLANPVFPYINGYDEMYTEVEVIINPLAHAFDCYTVKADVGLVCVLWYQHNDESCQGLILEPLVELVP